MDQPEHSHDRLDSPEKLLEKKKERLRRLGDLLIEASSLIERLTRYPEVNHIDYEMTFPVSPNSLVHLPEAFALSNPDYITVTAGKTKLDQRKATNDTEAPKILPYLSIDIVAGAETLHIAREGETLDTDTDDVVLNMQQQEPMRTLRDELRSETDEEFTKRITPFAKVPRSAVNALLMSLVMPKNQEFSHFANKDLLDINTFTYLIEALHTKAFETSVRGVYLFQKSNAELSFQNKDGDESFTLSYTNPKTTQEIIVAVDTKTGFDLTFNLYQDGAIHSINPTNDEIYGVQILVQKELAAIVDASGIVDAYAPLTDGNPEDIVEDIVTREDWISNDRLQREIGSILNQDGFDPPNPSTT